MGSGLPDLAEVLRLGETLSLIPIRADGSKKPVEDSWKAAQRQRAGPEQLKRWFGNGKAVGVAVVADAGSGFVECLDFDNAAVVKPFMDRVTQREPGLIERLVVQKTPRPGYQFIYRVHPEAARGNKALALRQIGFQAGGEPDVRADIETRGQGGYFLTYQCPPECHKTGRCYELLRGDLAHPPLLSEEERELLWEVARSFNLYTPPRLLRSVDRAPSAPSGELRPGDDFNERADWTDLLETNGARLDYRQGEQEYWRRPGKDQGHSASLHVVAADILNIFTTSWPGLEAGHGYDKFGFLVYTRYNGDFGAATRALRAEGYGGPAIGGPARGVVDWTRPETLAPKEGVAKRFPFLDLDELLAKPPPAWQIVDQLEQGAISLVFGLSGSAKSFLAVSYLMAIVSGQDWFGHRVVPGNGLYVNADGGRGFRDRVDAWIQYHGREGWPGKLTVLDQEMNLFNPAEVWAFAAQIIEEDLQPALIVFDTQAECAPGADEVSTKDMSLIVAALKYIQRETGAGIMVVHHSTKDGLAVRGVMNLYNACTTVVKVEIETTRVNLHCEKQRNFPVFLDLPLKLTPHGPSCVLLPQNYSPGGPSRSQLLKEADLERVVQLIAEAEHEALETGDETRRMDFRTLAAIARLPEGTLKTHLRELIATGRIHHWIAPLPGRSRRAVYGIVSDGPPEQ